MRDGTAGIMRRSGIHDSDSGPKCETDFCVVTFLSCRSSSPYGTVELRSASYPYYTISSVEIDDE